MKKKYLILHSVILTFIFLIVFIGALDVLDNDQSNDIMNKLYRSPETFKFFLLILLLTPILTLYFGDKTLYPLLSIRIPSIFLSYAVVSWLIYAFLNLETFVKDEVFFQALLDFAKFYLPLLLALSIIAGWYLHEAFDKQFENKHLIKINIRNILKLLIIGLASLLILYFSHKVIQAPLPRKYANYTDLYSHKPITSPHYEMQYLMSRNELNSDWGTLSFPYYVKQNKEVLIFDYDPDRKQSAESNLDCNAIYKIDTLGELIDSITDRLRFDNYTLYPAKDAGNTDKNVMNSWIYDGNTSWEKIDSTKIKSLEKITTIPQETDAIHFQYFYKTEAFTPSYDRKFIGYYGNSYCNLIIQKDTLHFYLWDSEEDSEVGAYTLQQSLRSQALFFTSDNPDISFLLVRRHDLYVIKRKKS